MDQAAPVLDEALRTLQEELQKEAWDLYRKLGCGYSHRSEAWTDMVRLGEIATALIKLDEARAAIHKGGLK